MSTGNNYFNPIDINGLQVFTATGQSGWYQYDVPDAQVSTLPGITVPNGAGGMVVQANTELAYCFSPERAAAGTTAWMTLAAGGTLVLSGPAWIKQFCVRLGLVAGASFTVQFLRGNIGPILEINAPVTGGVNPPPPPGLSAVYTYNTVHVMDGGDDATGTRNRLDLPFATIAAASAVLQPGDTMVIWPGSYVGQLAVGNVTYHLLGSVVTNPIGSTVECGGDIMKVTGFGMVRGGGASPCVIVDGGGYLEIQAQVKGDQFGLAVLGGSTAIVRGDIEAKVEAVAGEAGCVMRIYGAISGTDGVGAEFGGADAMVWGDIYGKAKGLSSSGACTVYGNVLSANSEAASCAGGKQLVYGNVTADNGQCASVSAGVQMICGDVTSTNGTAALVEGSGATQLIFGNVTATNGVAASTLTAAADSSQTIHGNVYSDVTYAARAGAGPQLIYGNVETGDGTAALCTGYMTIYGNVTGRNSGAAIECNFGLLTVVGNVQGLDGFATGVNASAYGGTVKVVVHGNVTSNTSALTVKSIAGAVVEVHGNITNTGTGQGLVVEAAGYPDTVGTVTGLVTAAGGVAVYCNGGITTLGRGATTQAAAAAAVQCFRNDSVLILEGNAYLRSTGAAPSITFSGTGATATIRSYGAYASAAVAVGMTVTGTLNILP